MASKEVLQDILQARLSDKEFERVKCDWAAFCKNPAAYKNTVVIECVLHWLQELRGTSLSVLHATVNVLVVWILQLTETEILGLF